MRKLVYVGHDKYDTKGFTFKEIMEDITEEKKVDTDRIAKVRKKMGL